LSVVPEPVNNSITSYRGADNGDVAPQEVIADQVEATGIELNGIAVDAVNGDIFVTNSGANSINVYASDASANAYRLLY
jgi:hypothetical protein